jgi:hypothetical protein
VAGDPARSRELPEQLPDTCPILAHVRIDLAVGAFQPGGRDQCRAAVPGAGQVDGLLTGERNQPRRVGVHERESWAGSPVAEEPRLDVLSGERPLEQRVVFQVDLPDREVVAGSPPRIDSSQLAIGQVSEFVSTQFQGHTSSLVRGWRSSEGLRSLRTSRPALEATLRRFPESSPGPPGRLRPVGLGTDHYNHRPDHPRH